MLCALGEEAEDGGSAQASACELCSSDGGKGDYMGQEDTGERRWVEGEFKHGFIDAATSVGTLHGNQAWLAEIDP